MNTKREMKKEELRQKLIEILTPPSPRDASLHGGMIDWEYKYNKQGLNYLVREIEKLFNEFVRSEEPHDENKETWEKEFYSQFTHDWPAVFYTKEEIKDLPQKVVNFIRQLLKSLIFMKKETKTIKEAMRIAYDQGHQDGASDQRMSDQEFMKRLKLEVDTVICDCGKSYKDSDLADLIYEHSNPIKI